ncbi:MAG: monofunctional biosynthetic peptidoglycan transglycosylase [Sphingobacteriales bacterium SCN 48-20]|jgi:monofunctional biosynthetic peptidoglycan transglycosylase|uniref:monofunctional biosynthetic peptidoglycan transglycosylase n=1 Tax=Terrimonas ferruginea TaxID=249 RepID=UPI00086A3D97|nr:monofunctional biosynthetic peptidoglycan transglycosylase [Terrimonas ferruginea]MBN8783484.1 monofunctional biosynthetic peptidoglycan transglycosylase [Terrimonas ferruginea]ODT92007.1 MAG: monofunctional biosynthetic peptidoglycan transglycosylase [Sphingobacteriales bacterium SCN 48-20]OJW40244.1 MAG: monofunctional biosynthetic peptidoglycan transglycosylase [Sphingobacteriales bacterium 48-107]
MATVGVFSNIWRWTKRILLILFIAQFVYIILLRWVNPPITVTQFVSWVTGHGMKRDYVSRNNISFEAKLAVIASEDQLFADHRGFDWKSIEKAMKYNEKKPGRQRGGSTISQQVAKNVFLWQGGGYFRKGLEAYFTFMIETFWSKERILEVYLNVSEMGDGIFGIEAAAQSYFGKPAKDLNRREAALVAACLPSPKRYKVKPPSPYVSGRATKIAQQMAFLFPDPDIKEIIGLEVKKKEEPKTQPAKK